MRKITLAAIIMFGLLIASCNDSDDTGLLISQLAGCSIAQQNQFVHHVLLERYLWYREVPQYIDYSDFDSPEQTLDFLKFDDKDRFSYIADADAFSSLFGEGQYVGYGFSWFIDDNGRVWIKFVYDDSNARIAGLERGDEILRINGDTVQQISDALAWDEVFGASEIAVPVTMQIRKKDGSTVDIEMTKSVVNINTVLYSSVLDQNGIKVGYLLFNSFLNTSIDELEDVFGEFSAQNVTKVILDLRYNRGGSVGVASHLAGLLFDNDTDDQLFTLLQQNDKYRNLDSTYYFTTLPNQLELQQLVVITTGSTASASEMIINGLKPFMSVKTVGTTTFGKPVGMNGFEFCDRVMLPITFAVYNAAHDGDYFEGIAADCVAEDDVSFAFGDVSDPMLGEALRVTQGLACSAQKAAVTHRLRPPATSPASLQDIIGAV